MSLREGDRSTMTFRVIGISGSGRKGSYNTALLRAAKQEVLRGVILEIVDVSHFPLFNEDLESQIPAAVKDFKQKVKGADAVLLSTPEYNYSLSAIMKNAIEWGNRPDGENSWQGKPAAIVSASASLRGGARAQMHLRQILVDLDMHPINQPQLLVPRAEEKFDKNLRLTDERSRQTLRELLIALVQWGVRLRANLADFPAFGES